MTWWQKLREALDKLFKKPPVVPDPKPPVDPKPPPVLVEEQKQMKDELNLHRATKNVSSLADNAALTRAAQGHAVWMAKHHDMSHTGDKGSTFIMRTTDEGYAGRPLTEVIAAGYLPTPKDAVKAWISSHVGHKEAIEDPNADECGLGWAIADNGDTYVCVVLGSKRALRGLGAVDVRKDHLLDPIWVPRPDAALRSQASDLPPPLWVPRPDRTKGSA